MDPKQRENGREREEARERDEEGPAVGNAGVEPLTKTRPVQKLRSRGGTAVGRDLDH